MVKDLPSNSTNWHGSISRLKVPIKMSETPSSSFSMIHPTSSESGQTFSPRHFSIIDPVVAKRICFYKSGDPQFNGIKMVVNHRSIKTFDALLDNLSRKIPLPFGVRNISTPRGLHSITNLEELEDGKSYICSHRRKMKPVNLEQASRKPLPWQSSRPISARHRAAQMARQNRVGAAQWMAPVAIRTPKRITVFKNGDMRTRCTVLLSRKVTQSFEAFLDHLTELLQYPVVRLYAVDGRKVANLQAVFLTVGALVAAGREPFKPGHYDLQLHSIPSRFSTGSSPVVPRANANPGGRKMSAHAASSSRSQIYSLSSDQIYSNDYASDGSLAPDNPSGLEKNNTHTGRDLLIIPSDDDIEKSILVNQDGSMTIEMKVRVKIKEEESINWTTTVSRAGLRNNDKKCETDSFLARMEDPSPNLNISACTKAANVPCLKRFKDEEGSLTEEINTPVTRKEVETHNIAVWDKSTASQDLSQVLPAQDKLHFHRPPTPGPRRMRKKKALVESVTLVSDDKIHEKLFGKFSFSEEREDGERKSEYCMVTHSSKVSSVSNDPTPSDVTRDDHRKNCLESEGGVRLLAPCQQKGGLVDTTNQSMQELMREKGLLQAILGKSVVQEEIIDCLISGRKVSVKNQRPSKIKGGSRPFSADSTLCHHNGSRRESSLKRTTPPPLRCSNLYTPPADIERSQGECFPSGITFSSVRERQPTSFLYDLARKAGKFPQWQGMNSTHGVSVSEKTRFKNEERHFPREIRQRAVGQISDINCYEAFSSSTVVPGGGSHKDAISPVIAGDSKDSLCPRISMHSPPNESPYIKRHKVNSPLARVKPRSLNKLNLASSTKGEVVWRGKVCSQKEYKCCKKTLGTGDTCHMFNFLEQTQKSLYAPRSSERRASGYKMEPEKNSYSLVSDTQICSKKPKIQKMEKITSGPRERKSNYSTGPKDLDPWKQDYVAHNGACHSLQNYVESWLRNIFPSPLKPRKLAPLCKKEGDTVSCNISPFPVKGSHILSGEENGPDIESVQGAQNVNLVKNNPGKPLCGMAGAEEPTKQFYEKQNATNDTNPSFLGEPRSLSHSNFIHVCDAKMPGSNKKSDSDEKEKEAETNPAVSRLKAEVAVQVGSGVSNVVGLDSQGDFLWNLLLPYFQEVAQNFQKATREATGKQFIPPDISSLSSPLLDSSSNLLLACLLVLNLKGNLNSFCKDDSLKATCTSLETAMLLQFLKQIAVVEGADDLKMAVSNLQGSMNRLFSGKEQEHMCSVNFPENLSVAEIPRVPELNEHKNLNEAHKLENTSTLEGPSAGLENSTPDESCVLDVACSPVSLDETGASVPDRVSTSEEPRVLDDGGSHMLDEAQDPDGPCGLDEVDPCVPDGAPAPDGTSCVLDNVPAFSEICLSDKAPGVDAAGNLSESCVQNEIYTSNKTLNSEENADLKQTEELESLSEAQNSFIRSAHHLNLSDLNIHESEQPKRDENLCNQNAFSRVAEQKLNEEELKTSLLEFQDSSSKELQDKNIDTSYDKEESRTSVEPGSTTNSMASDDRNLSELESSEEIENLNVTHLQEEKNAGGQSNLEPICYLPSAPCNLELTTEILETDRMEGEENIENNKVIRKSTTSLMVCYDSKQSTEKETNKEENKSRIKMILKEIHSDSSVEFRKHLKSPVTSDCSDCRADTENEYTSKTSSDVSNESGEEMAQRKEYNTGYVKRTIERLFGKEEAVLKPLLRTRSQNSRIFPKDSEKCLCIAEKMNCPGGHNFRCSEQVSRFSLPIQECQEDSDVSGNICGEDTSHPPSLSPNGTNPHHFGKEDSAACCPKTQSQARFLRGPDAVLIDKGKWLLKENHLQRMSPPENTGMYGIGDTTSTDTLLDHNNDDIPYSHYGNFDPGSELVELSSSDLEDSPQTRVAHFHYSNIPQGSDLDTFDEDLTGVQNKTNSIGYTSDLRAEQRGNAHQGPVCTSVTQLYPDFRMNSSDLPSVEFRLSGNKVHPMGQPLPNSAQEKQPSTSSNMGRRTLQEEDSLDKLHAICGQHCPILTAVVQPVNEEGRGFAYQKASDIENKWAFHLWAKTCPFSFWPGKNLFRNENNSVNMKKASDNTISEIVDRVHFKDALDFINSRSCGMLKFSTLLEENNLMQVKAQLRKQKYVNFLQTQLFIMDDMNSNTQDTSNQGNESLIVVDENNNLLNNRFQSSRANLNQMTRKNLN
uniref:Oxygen-regulated protein 1 n=1 Tax=Ornithorhynchus anatinus TaxID=9258 RepID=F6XX87_ORNAN